MRHCFDLHFGLIRAGRGLGLLCLAWTLAPLASAWEPVQLAPYPQKLRTFYQAADAAVPVALRSNSFPLPVGNITARLALRMARCGLAPRKD